MSTALPAVSGTTARMVRDGHCCAMAGTDTSATRIAAKHHQRLIPTSLARQGLADRSPGGAKAKSGQTPCKCYAFPGLRDQGRSLCPGDIRMTPACELRCK